MSVPLLVRSPLLEDAGVVHGFSLRTGGLGEPPFDSLNLAHGVGDSAETVRENRSRFETAVGLPEATLFEISQVHGAAVVTLGEVGSRARSLASLAEETRGLEADALVAPSASLGPRLLGVRTADCVPVLAVHPGSGGAAAIHVGWRGAVAGVLTAGLRALLEAAGPRAASAELLVAIGPHIRTDAFEVGPEVAARLAEAAGGDARVVRDPSGPGGRPRVDLAAVCLAQLAHLEVPRDRVDVVPGCTYEDSDRFFSHRRERGRTGRHLAVVAGP